jgi:hypothetical protein
VFLRWRSTQRARSAAKRAGVPVVEVTEAPPNDSTFEAWQLSQLDAFAKAVGQP